MNWNKIQPTVKTSYVGHATLEMTAGDLLKLQLHPSGEGIQTLLSEEVPEDKQWKVDIKITAIEDDV